MDILLSRLSLWALQSLSGVVLSLTFLSSSAAAQGRPSEATKSLQKQIDDLRETQQTIQQELQEIKALLQGGAAPSNLPPPNLTLSVAGKSFKGDKGAKLILIEFSDYQCPFCARFFKETFPQIEKNYINTGKVRYVLRDFPLEALHSDAFAAHEAANCAGEQGKYWEMHDRLFQNQNRLGATELPKHAEAVGVNLPAFQQCLSSGKQAAEVRKDQEGGRKAGVQGTPTFFLGFQEADGKTVKVARMIVGAQPYAHFKDAIEQVFRQGEK